MIRQSRRVRGNAPQAPAVVPQDLNRRSSLFQLMANETVHGRAAVVDGASGWNLDAGGSGAGAGTGAAGTDAYNAFVASRAAFSPAASTCLPCDDSDKKPAAKGKESDYGGVFVMNPEEIGANASTVKLVQFDQLQKIIDENCVCRHCGSPVKLTEKTYGIATNVSLTCVPCDKRNKAHKSEVRSQKLNVPTSASADGRKTRIQEGAKTVRFRTLIL